ncbi:MAG: glycosyltransferase [Microbacteriaceae bacterium]|nr:glycosyltransferase [Microbacteriaceae bacterium]
MFDKNASPYEVVQYEEAPYEVKARQSDSQRLNILYFGVHDLAYPRNRRLRTFFIATHGDRVDVLPIEPTRGYLRNFVRLLNFTVRQRTKTDVVILSEFSLQFAILGWLAARLRGAIFAVDWFVGLHETRIEDNSFSKPSFVRRIGYQVADWVAVTLADEVFSDTDLRANNLTKKFLLKSPALSVPVGAPPWATPSLGVPPLRAVGDQGAGKPPLRLLYYGNFLPLHGVPLILEAVSLAARRREIALTLIGDGRQKRRALELVSSLGISSRCKFVEPVREVDLLAHIHQYDVILGIFGPSPKARSVIANKVWQGLACGMQVVTQKSQALDEISEFAGNQLVQVDASSSKELSEWFVQSQPFTVNDSSADAINLRLEEYVESKCTELRDRLILRCH